MAAALLAVVPPSCARIPHGNTYPCPEAVLAPADLHPIREGMDEVESAAVFVRVV